MNTSSRCDRIFRTGLFQGQVRVIPVGAAASGAVWRTSWRRPGAKVF